MAHDDIGLPVIKRGERHRRRRQIGGNTYAGLKFGEALQPIFTQHAVNQIITAVQANPAAQFFTGRVIRQTG